MSSEVDCDRLSSPAVEEADVVCGAFSCEGWLRRRRARRRRYHTTAIARRKTPTTPTTTPTIKPVLLPLVACDGTAMPSDPVVVLLSTCLAAASMSARV